MSTSTRGNRRKWATGIIVSAAAGMLFGLAGVGAFLLSCQWQSETYDLSRMPNLPGRVSLAEIPQALVQAAAREDDLIPAQVLAETQFGLGGNELRTRVVRGMVASLIEQKFSAREVAEFYFNCVTPGVAELHRLARHDRPEPVEATPVSYVAEQAPQLTAQPSVPEAMTPLSPADEASIPVRRAVAVEKSVRRALPMAASGYSTDGMREPEVRRAMPIGPMGSVVAQATPIGDVRVSPAVVYRVAVVDR